MNTAESVLDVPVNSASLEQIKAAMETAADALGTTPPASVPFSVAAYEVMAKRHARKEARNAEQQRHRVVCGVCGDGRGTLQKARTDEGELLADANTGRQAYVHPRCKIDPRQVRERADV